MKRFYIFSALLTIFSSAFAWTPLTGATYTLKQANANIYLNLSVIDTDKNQFVGQTSTPEELIFEASGTGYVIKNESGKYLHVNSWNVEAGNTATVWYIQDSGDNILLYQSEYTQNGTYLGIDEPTVGKRWYCNKPIGNSIALVPTMVKSPAVGDQLTYTFTWGGQTRGSETVTASVGDDFPQPTTSFYGVSLPVPNRKVTASDILNGVTVECDLSSFPFEFADSYAHITQWYNLYGHSQDHRVFYYGHNSEKNVEINRTGVNGTVPTGDEAQNYLWAFVGNPFDGFYIQNYAAGSSLGIDDVQAADAGYCDMKSTMSRYFVCEATDQHSSGPEYNLCFYSDPNADWRYLNSRSKGMGHWNATNSTGSHWKVVEAEAPLSPVTDVVTIDIESSWVKEYLAQATSVFANTSSNYGSSYFDTSRTPRADWPTVVAVQLTSGTASTATLNVYLDAQHTQLWQTAEVSLSGGSGSFTLRNMIPGQTYYLATPTSGVSVSPQAVEVNGQLRMIASDKGFNIRDLGGWQGLGGKTVKYEQLYRGASLGGTDMYGTKSDITDEDKAEFQRIGIGAQLDLRAATNAGRYTGEPSYHSYSRGETTLNDCDFNNTMTDYGAYDEDASVVADVAWTIYELKQGRPVYFHCRQGADRTGTIAFLLEGLLGCGAYTNTAGGNQMALDYELTGFSQANLVDNWQVSSSYRGAQDAYNSTGKLFRKIIDLNPGGVTLNSLQEKCYYYLNQQKNIKIDAADLDWFIQYMLDMDATEYAAYRPSWAGNGGTLKTLGESMANVVTYASPQPVDPPVTPTVCEATWIHDTDLNAMTTGQTKTILIASTSTNRPTSGKGGFLGSTGTGFKYSNVDGIDWTSDGGVTCNANAAANNADYKWTITKTADGFTIQDKDGHYLMHTGIGVGDTPNEWKVAVSATMAVGNFDDNYSSAKDQVVRFLNASNTASFLNNDGPKMAGGNAGWSIWRVYEVVEATSKTYTCHVTGCADGKVVYGSHEYGDNAQFDAELDASQLSAKEISGYVGHITVTGTDITATYTVDHSFNPATLFSGKYIMAIGEEVTTFTPNQWYLVKQNRDVQSPIYDNGANANIMRAADNSVVSVGDQANDKKQYLVRFIPSDDFGNTYYIQFGTSRFFGVNTDNSSIKASTTPGNYLVYNATQSNSNWTGHFAMNETSDGVTYGYKVDTNPQGYSIAFWSTGQTTSGANNVWAFYPVTVADFDLNAYKANVKNNFADYSFGDGLGEYSYNSEAIDFDTAVDACTTKEQVDALAASVALNMPVANTFLRVKANPAWNAAAYLTSTNVVPEGKTVARAQFADSAVDGTILFYDGAKLVNYMTGLTLVNNAEGNGFAAWADGAADGATVTFAASDLGTGLYTIATKSGRYMYTNPGMYADAGSSANALGYTFVLEDVTTLPVTLAQVGDVYYSTLYLPMNATVEGAEVYGATYNTPTSLVMTQLEAVPAHAGVVLASGGASATVTLGGTTSSTSELTGVLALTETTSDVVRVFSKKSGKEKVGFYKLPSGVTTLKAFKAYYNAPSAGTAAFELDWSGTTGIGSILGKKNAEGVYDLQGRKVNQTVRGNLYIIDGRKVVK